MPTKERTSSVVRIVTTEAYVLGFISVLSYVYAFRFESGYLSYFGVGPEFITFGGEFVLRAVAAFAFIAPLFLPIAIRISQMSFTAESENILTPRDMALILFYIVLVFLFFYPLLMIVPKILSYTFAALLGAIIVLYAVGCILKSISTGSPRALSTEELFGASIANAFSRPVVFLLLTAIVAIFVAPLACMVGGYYLASQRGSFYHLEDRENLLLIRRYGDTFIFAEWAEPEFSGSFTTLSIQDLSKSRLLHRQIP